MKTVQQLREKRAAKAKEARKIIDDAGENFTKDHTAKCDAIYAEIDQIDSQIEVLERQLKLETDLDKPEDSARKRAEQSGRSVDEETDAVTKDRAVFGRWLRGGVGALTADDLEHVRSRIKGEQSAFEPAKGGYLAPPEFATSLLARLKAFGGVRQIANVITTGHGRRIDWPTVDETAEEGEIVGENTAASDSDMNFGTVAIDAYKYSSKIITVPIELLQDSAMDVVPIVNGALTTRLGRITNKHYTTGTGVNQPRGFITAAATGKTTVGGQTTSVIFEDLVDLEHSVDPAYRGPSCRWSFHDNTLKALKKLKDSTGRPLWLPGLSASDPDTLLRYQYSINQHMASAIAASATTVAFGDFKKYLIRDVMDVTLFRFEDSAYMKKGQVAFLAWMRTDADLIDASNDAIKVLVQAAS